MSIHQATGFIMNISLEKKVAVGLVIVVAMLLGIGYGSYRSTGDLINREVRAAQTHQVRETIEHLLYLMEDLEDNQRLDLLTGENQYLGLQREMGQNVEAALHDLSDLTRGSQIQQEQLLALRRLIDLRLEQLKESIDLRNAGRFEVNEQKVLQHVGKETMDKILLVLGKMREQEQVLFINWSKKADRAASLVYGLIIGGTVLTILLTFVGGWRVLYDLSKRKRAERDVLEVRARQELILRTVPGLRYIVDE
jgi:CHASE3 domain sensor protein